MNRFSSSHKSIIALAIITRWVDTWMVTLSNIGIVPDVHEIASLYEIPKIGVYLAVKASLWEKFQLYLDSNYEVKHIYKMSDLYNDRDFFYMQIAPTLGKMLKRHPWWVANSREIESQRRKLKKVQRVMES